MGALASYGVETIRVCRSPRIALFSTGDELGSAMPDANAPIIAGAIAELGFEAPCPEILRDNRQYIADAIRAALAGTPDIIISTGGVSVGAHDHIAEVLEDLGATVHFHGVAMRPGKPVLFARLPNGTLYFGLPGNPVAALPGFRFFVIQAFRTMLDRGPEKRVAVSAPTGGKPGLTVFLKAMFDPTQDRAVILLDGQESHKLRPLVCADRWVSVEAGIGAWAYPVAGRL